MFRIAPASVAVGRPRDHTCQVWTARRWGTGWLLPAATGLSLYSVGAGAMEGFVAYPSWLAVGEAEFVDFHRITDARVVGCLVAPFAGATAATAALVVRPQAGLPRWLPGAALAAQTVTWLSTVLVEVPIQRRLTRQGYSPDQLRRLVRVDRLTRQVPNALLAGLSMAMIAVAHTRSAEAG